MSDTLGDRIRARRDARLEKPKSAEVAELHARIDKLIADNNLKT